MEHIETILSSGARLPAWLTLGLSVRLPGRLHRNCSERHRVSSLLRHMTFPVWFDAEPPTVAQIMV